MKIKNILISVIIGITIYSCHKDSQIVSAIPDPVSSNNDFVFSPCTTLKEPSLGWYDSTEASPTTLWRILYNPVNTDEILYVVEPKLYNYNLHTKVRKLICNDAIGMPSINKYGWLTFTDSGGGIYSMKTNGDSLSFLNQGAFDPFWDYSGKYIIFLKNHIYFRMEKDGSSVDTLKNQPTIVAFFKNSNKIISFRNQLTQLYLKDMDTGEEKILYNRSPSLPLAAYDHMTVDNKDENIYWWNFNNIYSLNITSLKLDTIIRGCPNNTVYPAGPNIVIGATNISYNSDKLTFLYVEYIPISNVKRYTKTRGLQYDLNTKKLTEIHIFD